MVLEKSYDLMDKQSVKLHSCAISHFVLRVLSAMTLLRRKFALLSLGIRIDQNLLLCNNDPLLDGVFHAW